MTESGAKAGGNRSCCVVNCRSVAWRDKFGYYSVVREDKEQTDAWIRAIHRVNAHCGENQKFSVLIGIGLHRFSFHF